MKVTLTCLFLTLLCMESLYSQKLGKDYQIYINNIGLPLNDKGVLAGINVLGIGPYGKFDGKTFLKTSGFFLSGYADGVSWANGAVALDYVNDYLSGTYEYGENDPRAQLYKISSQDTPFDQSWQDWIDAVELGADFYDGNNDGIYNPIDLNANGLWDSNEDRPDLIGDEMIWCVYHDNKPAINRIWDTVEPQGIEIRQSLFAYQNVPDLENVVFVRYRILNTGSFSSNLTYIYFGTWADPDIGNPNDDLVGVDVIKNAGYAYGNQPDSVYGNQVPCFMMDILSGPQTYIAGETFIDNNGNGIYDEGIDVPIDTAYSYGGQLLGIETFPGAKNLPISSSVMFLESDPDLRNPLDEYEARNYSLGLNRVGVQPDPCSFAYGQVRGGVDCATVDPRFWFSGDPVTNVGWICNINANLKQMTNIGPFKLEAGKEREIFVAYLIGRGNDGLNSISTTRGFSQIAQSVLESNFDVISSVENAEDYRLNYQLYQNYPNPFNPSTVIEFSLPENVGYVKLSIYNTLGEKVAELVNTSLIAGKYSYIWNAQNVASGMYIYELRTDKFVSVKKMVLMR